MLLPITKFIQYNLGYVTQWNAYNSIIPKGCAIICKTDNNEDLILKIGDNSKLFRDLPIILYFKYIEGCYYINNINLINMIDIDKILYIDSNKKISASNFKETDLFDLFNGNASANLGFNLISPIINGPNQIGINQTIMLHVDVYSLFSYCNIGIDTVEWTLPGGDILLKTDTLLLSYTSTNDITKIGNTLTLSVRVKNKYNYYSRSTIKNIKIVDSTYDGYVLTTSLSS